MCGIVGYIGHQPAAPILIKGLERLEYRGYDSAGIALQGDGIDIYKKTGKVANLKAIIPFESATATIGMGHTRWATHGEPCDRNAHPHLSGEGNLAIIHNGIIENYAAIKKELISSGYTFVSDTDTEVLGTLIEDIQKKCGCEIENATRMALNRVDGAYAIVIMDKNDPGRLIAAKKGSPMVIGIGEGEYFIASDATPIVEYTKEVIYLEDEQVVVIDRNGYEITNLTNESQNPFVQTLDLKLDEIEKGGFPHFMLKEIFGQPQSVADCMRGRLNAKEGTLTLGGIHNHAKKLVQADKITIVACGTSWHAGLVAEYIIEEFCRIPVEVEYASEFRYRNPVIKEGDVVLAISQSGETADTLAAIELAKSRGAIVLGIVNAVGSSISRATHEGAYLHAGPEIGVASTKAFTGQLTVLYMIALRIAIIKGTITEDLYHQLLIELELIPGKIQQVLDQNEEIIEIAEKFKDATNFLYLGRGYNFPVALEGALKLKEISYIHAEGYPAAEMKHGPIALIDDLMPTVIIATKDASYDKIVSNIQEIKARKGKTIVIATKGDTFIPTLSDYTITIPKAHESLVPLLSVVPLQLLSYHIAVMRGCNVDQPRNLAKSVTVE